jgi:hypothetical protein
MCGHDRAGTRFPGVWGVGRCRATHLNSFLLTRNREMRLRSIDAIPLLSPILPHCLHRNTHRTKK